MTLTCFQIILFYVLLKHSCSFGSSIRTSTPIVAKKENCVKPEKGFNSSQSLLLRFLQKDYKKDLRPVQDWQTVTTVYIDMTVYAILLVEEKDQTMTVHFMYHRRWKDEYLQWNKNAYDEIDMFSIPKDTIWIPDVMTEEYLDAGHGLPQSFVYVTHKGMIHYQKPLRMKIICALNIHFFPFDVHRCNFTYHSQLHTIEHINITFWRQEEQLEKDLNKFYNNGEWRLLNIRPFSTQVETEDGIYAKVIFQITFKRYPLYYVVSLIIPSMFLMIMDLVGFFIPPDTGERISFKVTLLLGYSVFLLLVSETLPPSAHGTPIIETYFLVCMALLLISLTESIIIVQLINKKDFQKKRMPMWLKKFMLGKMSGLLGMKQIKSSLVSTMNTSDNFQDMDKNSTGELTRHAVNEDGTEPSAGNTPLLKLNGTLEMILNEIVKIQQHIAMETNQQQSLELLQIGYVLDKLLYYMYLMTMLAYTVTMAVIWRFNIEA